MKTIGLVGGIGWASSAEYYKLLNLGVNKRLGGHNFAQVIVYSVNFADIHRNNLNNDWDATFDLLLKASEGLKAAGADAIMLGANTMHYLADRITQKIDLPLIHVAAVTGDAIVAQGLKKVALLGTKYTMELDFYKDTLAKNGLTTILPNDDERAFINHSIYDELAIGKFTSATKARYLDICKRLRQEEGAEGVILGCTEIPLLINQGDIDIPLFATTDIHADAAIDFMLG